MGEVCAALTLTRISGYVLKLGLQWQHREFIMCVYDTMHSCIYINVCMIQWIHVSTLMCVLCFLVFYLQQIESVMLSAKDGFVHQSMTRNRPRPDRGREREVGGEKNGG